MALYASLVPSGEITGCASHAGLAAVRFFTWPPSTDTLKRSKLVLHGSVFPATRALKYTVRPSLAITKSSLPPHGLEGTSPSNPVISATGCALGSFRDR